MVARPLLSPQQFMLMYSPPRLCCSCWPKWRTLEGSSEKLHVMSLLPLSSRAENPLTRINIWRLSSVGKDTTGIHSRLKWLCSNHRCSSAPVLTTTDGNTTYPGGHFHPFSSAMLWCISIIKDANVSFTSVPVQAAFKAGIALEIRTEVWSLECV